MLQMSFDEYNWTLYSDANTVQEARRDVMQLLDECDRCPYRKTYKPAGAQNDQRQEECWVCPLRLQMEQAMKQVEFLTSRVRKKRTTK